MAEIPSCGTYRAYQRHRRYNQPVDDACRQARNDYTAEHRQKPDAGERMRRYNRARHRALERLRLMYRADFYRLFREEQDRAEGS